LIEIIEFKGVNNGTFQAAVRLSCDTAVHSIYLCERA